MSFCSLYHIRVLGDTILPLIPLTAAAFHSNENVDQLKSQKMRKKETNTIKKKHNKESRGNSA